MTYPGIPITTPDWVAGYANVVDLESKVTDRFNALRALGFGYLGENGSSTDVVLATTAVFAGNAAVTFTLTERRRIKISIVNNFTLASGTNGAYNAQVGYNSGASAVIGSVNLIGYPAYGGIAATTAPSPASANTWAVVALNAGTYTAYAAVQRASGGGTSDAWTSGRVLVEDLGSA